MEKIIKVENNNVVKYPVDLTQEFPNTSFPIFPTQEDLPENYFLVESSERPELEFDEILEELTPELVNEKWKQVWNKKKIEIFDLLKKQKEHERYTYAQIQQYMDSVVFQKGYDNLVTACSYINSTNEDYAKEAKACIQWRDDVWKKVYEIFDQVKKEKLPYPKTSNIMKDLPVLKWP